MTGQRIGGPRHVSREELALRRHRERIEALEAQVRALTEAVEAMRRRDDPNPDEV